MKVCAVRMFFVLLTSLILVGCASESSNNSNVKPAPAASETSLRTPTKEILVTEGDFNKKYKILGQVDSTLEGVTGNVTGTEKYLSENEKQTKELLKKVAFTKYGDKVDAIINTKVQHYLKGGRWGVYGALFGAQNAVFIAEGIAVSFENEQEETAAKPEEALWSLKNPLPGVKENPGRHNKAVKRKAGLEQVALMKCNGIKE